MTANHVSRIIIALMMVIRISLPLQLQAQTSNNPLQHQAKFVWADDQGSGRNAYIYFRLDFALNEVPSTVNFNLFADSRYHLFVNGTFINYGPGRFYPTNPEYDTYNISQYLKEGENTIAVKVLSNGCFTYQVPYSKGGFCAWGEMKLKDASTINFETPGNWKFLKCAAYDSIAPKFSFAKSIVEIYDSRKDIGDWNKNSINLNEWSKPHVLQDQNHWGPLTTRCIPPLTQDEIIPSSIKGIYTLNNDEDIFSFRLFSPDVSTNDYDKFHRAFAYTYIYSPKEQTVSAGVWWGEYYLNGIGPLQRLESNNNQLNRNEILLNLKKGWNFFFFKYDIIWSNWEFTMSVPITAKLKFSPTKEPESQIAFMTAGPFQLGEEDQVKSLTLPFKSPDDLPKLSAGWIKQIKSNIIVNPAISVAWRYFNDSLPINNSKVTDINILGQTGNALVFDMGKKLLGRIFIEYDAPSGTTIDIGFSEDMNRNRPTILKRSALYSAVRVISAGGSNRWESFEPYGIRYLQINITGNAGQAVKIKRIGVIQQIYPFVKKGSFECSDPMLNSIWELGYRTLRVCSEDSYVDTPFRERGLYAGDAMPEYAITLATCGDSRLIKRCLELFQDMYAPLFSDNEGKTERIGDFPLLTLQYFSWYIDRTGDLEFAQKLYKPYRNMMEKLLKNRNSEGLFETGGVFIEWTKLNKSANLSSMHSLIASSYQQIAHIADKLGKTEDAARYKSISEEVSTLVRQKFWDGKVNAFRDGFKKGNPIDHFYPISSAWPVLWGISSKEQNDSLRPFFEKELTYKGYLGREGNVTPYGGFYILAALYRCGYADLAERFMRDYWAPMILTFDDTAWEDFSFDGGSTQSHAWSGGPTFFLTTQALGVDLGWPIPNDPKNIIIAPQAESISWAKGSVPYGNGVIKIDWKIIGNKLFINCDVPDGITWKVQPKGRLAKFELWVNGVKK